MSNQLQHRFLNIEVEPPAKMWDAINEALDDQNSVVADKLYSYAEAPKHNLWENISKELSIEVDTEVAPAQSIPFYKKYARPLRYGSAVAIIAVVAVTVSLLLNKDAVSNELSQQTSVNSSSNNTTATKQQSLSTPISNDQEEPSTFSSETGSNGMASSGVNTTQSGTLNRYLTVASETGQTVRLSKKAYEVFNCAENSKASLAYRCKENIEALQQKAATALASPSGDFASLMDMIKELEENK